MPIWEFMAYGKTPTTCVACAQFATRYVWLEVHAGQKYCSSHNSFLFLKKSVSVYCSHYNQRFQLRYSCNINVWHAELLLALVTGSPSSWATCPKPVSNNTLARMQHFRSALPVVLAIHWFIRLNPAIRMLFRLFVLRNSISWSIKSRYMPICVNTHSLVKTLCTNLTRNFAPSCEQLSPPGPLCNDIIKVNSYFQHCKWKNDMIVIVSHTENNGLSQLQYQSFTLPETDSDTDLDSDLKPNSYIVLHKICSQTRTWISTHYFCFR